MGPVTDLNHRPSSPAWRPGKEVRQHRRRETRAHLLLLSLLKISLSDGELFFKINVFSKNQWAGEQKE